MIPEVISFLKEDSGRKLSNRRSVAVYKLTDLWPHVVMKKTAKMLLKPAILKLMQRKKIMQVTKKALL